MPLPFEEAAAHELRLSESLDEAQQEVDAFVELLLTSANPSLDADAVVPRAASAVEFHHIDEGADVFDVGETYGVLVPDNATQKQLSTRRSRDMQVQCAACVMMVRPANFGFNPETAADNAFMMPPEVGENQAKSTAQLARDEFDAMVDNIRSHDIKVRVLEDTPDPVKPDCVFPNNWISFQADGGIAVYQMAAPSRQREVRVEDVQTLLGEEYICGSVYDFRELPECKAGGVLEGTGSLVLDRANRVAYACISDRTDEVLVGRFCEKYGYEPCVFTALDSNGTPIYHTNVVMSVGASFAVCCLDSIRDPEERARVMAKLQRDGTREVVPITEHQMASFAGNCMELASVKAKAVGGRSVLVMSETAHKSLDDEQIETIERYADICASSIHTIEHCGGGSARCMVAEVHIGRSSGAAHRIAQQYLPHRVSF